MWVGTEIGGIEEGTVMIEGTGIEIATVVDTIAEIGTGTGIGTETGVIEGAEIVVAGTTAGTGSEIVVVVEIGVVEIETIAMMIWVAVGQGGVEVPLCPLG